MRLVTAHALGVALGKQRCLGHERLLARVAGLAAGHGVCRRSMLVLVARGAHLLRRFVERGVLCLNVAMAARA